MPASLTNSGLTIIFDLPDCPPWSADLSDLPNPYLARDLAMGLVGLTHPHGSVATRSTARRYRATMRRLCRDLAEASFTGSLRDLTYSHMRAWWLRNNYADEQLTRRLFQSFNENHDSVHPTLAAQLASQPINAQTSPQPYSPYSDDEWRNLISTCETICREAPRAQRTEVQRAASGSDPLLGGPCRANIAWLMSHHGPLSGVDIARHLALPHKRINIQMVRDVRNAHFPTPTLQVVFRTLFAARSGMVADGVLRLKLSQIERFDDGTSIVRYIKGRTGPESLVLSSNATRLLDSWLRLSARLRHFATDTLEDQVWISTASESYSGIKKVVGVADSGHHYARVVRELKLKTDVGTPFELHLSRVRTTYLHRMANRGWTGRTTIDPNHTARVEGDFYTQQLTTAQQDSIEKLIEDAQYDLVRKAHPPAVLTAAKLAAHAHNFPATIREHLQDDEAVARLLNGEQDVFVGSCANQLAGQWGPKGKPCPARPWVCLLCPLAVFLPRHLENLIRLQEFFRKKAQELQIHEYLAIYGPYAQRLDTEILPKFGQSAREIAAALPLSDFTLPLRPEES